MKQFNVKTMLLLEAGKSDALIISAQHLIHGNQFHY